MGYGQIRTPRRSPTVNGRPAIVLNLKSPKQLFDERDPSPFRERDLDDDAVRYIVSSYEELPGASAAEIALYFETMAGFDFATIRNAIASHFAYEAELKRIELRQAFEQGSISLLIGVTFLFACTYLAHLIGVGPADPLRTFAHEGLFIMGWVAMWRPINLFLYEWWPVRAARKRFLEIALLDVTIQPIESLVANQTAADLHADAPKILKTLP